MTKTTGELNKALVLEAFDTLFNKRDYKAAEEYWPLLTQRAPVMSVPKRRAGHPRFLLEYPLMTQTDLRDRRSQT
jgi:hypothetical protein